MVTHIFFILTSLLQLSCGQQLVTQLLNPNHAASMTAPPGQGGPLGLLEGPASSLGQILINLLNYKLQWLNQLAGHLTGNPGAFVKPGVLPLGHPTGYPFMTTLVTTLSGNSPSVPGIHIAGAPVNHLAYPGAPTTSPPPQDFHWIPVLSPEPQTPAAGPSAQPVARPPTPAPQSPQALPPLASTGSIPVIPVVDFSPIETISQAPMPQTPTTTTTTPKPKT